MHISTKYALQNAEKAAFALMGSDPLPPGEYLDLAHNSAGPRLRTYMDAFPWTDFDTDVELHRHELVIGMIREAALDDHLTPQG